MKEIPQKYLLSGKIKNKIPFILMGIGAFFYILALVSPLTNLIEEKKNPSDHYKKNETHQKNDLKEKLSSHHKEENRHNSDKNEPKETKHHNSNNNEDHAPSYKKSKFFHSYLVSYTFFTSLFLGAIFFVLIQFLTKAHWSVSIRRLAEQMMKNSWLIILFSIPLLFGTHELYHWTHKSVVEGDAILKHKKPYLNLIFFYIRLAFYFTSWIIISRFYYKNSINQDMTGDEKITLKLQKYAPLSLVVYAITLTFFSIDLLMSLYPHWYSTIYGIYYFSGSVVGFLSLLCLTSLYLRINHYLKKEINVEHYHDIGKLLFGFMCFWAYIAFSQYFLIWYANLPEETLFYLNRLNYNWKLVSIILIFGHFIIPFLIFISRNAKRNLIISAGICFWLLIMHYIDLYWLISPNVDPNQVNFNYSDLFCFLGMGGLFLGHYLYQISKNPIIPLKDPRLKESLHFENA